MGFRNPFRIQVDENDVAYVSDYSPDAQTPQRSRGPAGVGRFEIVRKPANYGWPTCYKRDLGVLPVELPRVRARHHHGGHAAGHTRRDAARLQRPDAAQRLAVEHRGRPAVEPGLRDVPPVTNPDIWYSYRDNNTGAPLGTPCLGYYAPTAGADRARLDHRVPAAVPGALHGRRRPARHDEVQLRPGQPEPEEVPAVLRRLGDLRRVDAGHAARGQARRSEPRSRRSTASWTAAAGRTPRTARSCSSATTRWTCSSAPTARSTC